MSTENKFFQNPMLFLHPLSEFYEANEAAASVSEPTMNTWAAASLFASVACGIDEGDTERARLACVELISLVEPLSDPFKRFKDLQPKPEDLLTQDPLAEGNMMTLINLIVQGLNRKVDEATGAGKSENF